MATKTPTQRRRPQSRTPRRLVQGDIAPRQELAEQSVDDLGEISDLDPQRAGELILAARKHWFEQSQQV